MESTVTGMMDALNGSKPKDKERELMRVVLLHILDGDAVKDSPGALAADHRVIVNR